MEQNIHVIIEWIRTNIISGATDYRRYHARATKGRFGIKFINLSSNKSPKSEQYNIKLPNVDDEGSLHYLLKENESEHSQNKEMIDPEFYDDKGKKQVA